MNNYRLAIKDGVEVDLIYITAIERWGRDAQMVKAAEEMAELSAVLLKYVNLAPDDAERDALKKRILDEMADVEIMLEQLGIMTGCNYDEYLYKLWRLSRRLGIKAGLDGDEDDGEG